MPVYEKDGSVMGAEKGSVLASALEAEGWSIRAEKPKPPVKPRPKKPPQK